jgi:hypothetical protein
MSVRELSLPRRLALALVPGLVTSVIGAAQLLWTPPWPEERFAANMSLYLALFGGFVLAPFVSASTHRRRRVALLVVAAPVIGFLCSALSEIGDQLFDYAFPSYVFFSVIFLFTTLALYLLLGIVAPVRFTLRLTASLGLAGIIQGLVTAFFVDHFLCIIFCDAIDNLALAVPVVLWPVLFCTAVVLGIGEPGRQSIPGTPS